MFQRQPTLLQTAEPPNLPATTGMVALLYQNIGGTICNGSSALVCHGEHYIMAGEHHDGACHQVGMGSDTGSNKLFCIFMATWYSP